MTDTVSELVPRRQVLKELRISDSSERRERTGGGEWPPHLRIGSKIFYRRQAIDDFIRQQEAISEAAHQERVGQPVDSETMTAILRRAKVLADAAPPLTSQQVLLLRSIFANRAGGDGA
jgi:hypothetical protein